MPRRSSPRGSPSCGTATVTRSSRSRRQLVKAIACSYDDGMAIAGRVHNDGKAVVRVGAKTECERVGRILAEIGLRVTVAES